MPFFMNPFDTDFKANLVMAVGTSGWGQQSLTYNVPANKNNSLATVAWNPEPYDFTLTTDDILTIRYNNNQINGYTYATLNISLTGVTTAAGVVSALNGNATFATFWNAKVKEFSEGKTVFIEAKPALSRLGIKYWFENLGAEEALRFNKMAGIAEIPSYFSRHRFEAYTDAASPNFMKDNEVFQLIQLDVDPLAYINDPLVSPEITAAIAAVNLAIIQEFTNNPSFAGVSDPNPDNRVKYDWELLKGRTALYTFTKKTFSGGLPTEIIEYNAGSVVGDAAKRTVIVYSGVDPIEKFEMPHILVAADMITPP